MNTANQSCRLSESSKFREVGKILPEKLVKLALQFGNKIGQLGIILATVGGAISSGNSAVAQINSDQTLGTESSVVAPNVDIRGVISDRIDGGAIRGSQLFHSFSEFNVNTGRGAYFSNPTGIENIFSRVTGINASNIDGKLGVLGNANLFLLNPNGIIFGPNASLDLGGSFLASTGNSFIFNNGQEFSATNPSNAPLLSVSVPLGVQFNQTQPNAIINSGNLGVSTGQNLILLGGSVVSTGNLSAPGGQVAVAAVPSGSLVNLNSSGQLLNIETSSTEVSSSETQSSIAKLLTENNQTAFPGLTLNSDGKVDLVGSDLSVGDGDVVAKKVLAQTLTLTASNNLTLIESHLNATGDLNLLAGDTVRVRDSVTKPFVAQAGGKLLVQGKEGIDIFALNHPSSGLVSGGDLILRSANTVGGDTHYWTGGSFRIEELDGSLGGLFSPYDPIIRALGDVSFASYTGASLHIFAGGSVKIDGNVEITGADGVSGLEFERVYLSNDDPNGTRSFVDIDGKNSPTLDIRAGVSADAISIPEIQGNLNSDGNNINPDTPDIGITPGMSGNITIGSISNLSGAEYNIGQILITNQYHPNSLPGSIKTGLISTYGDVTLNSRGDITTSGKIDTTIDQRTTSDNRIAGDIRLIADGNIKIDSDISSSSSGDNGRAGDIILKAGGDITARGSENPVSITSISNNNDVDKGFSTITIKSLGGSVFLNNAKLSTTNTGTEFAGDIEINGTNIQIDNSQIQSRGVVGRIFIGTDDEKKQVTPDNVNIRNSYVDTQTISGIETDKEPAKDDGIQIRSNGDIKIENSTLTAQTGSNDKINSMTLPPGSITLDAVGSVYITGSTIQNIVSSNTKVQKIPDYTPTITIKGSSIDINYGAQLSSSTSGRGDAGSVFLKARDSVALAGEGTTIFSNVEARGEGNGGNIDISAGSLSLTGGAQLQTLIRRASTEQLGRKGDAGNISIKVTDTVKFDGFSKIDNTTYPSAAFSTVEAGGVGDAGTINILANSISLTEGAGLYSSNSGEGKAGSVVVVSPKVFVSGTATNEQPRDFHNTRSNREGIFAEASQEKGIAGDIGIITNELRVENGAEITVSSPDGQAGDLLILAKEISLNNGALIATTGENAEAATEGGNIILISDEKILGTFFQLLQNPDSVNGNTQDQLTQLEERANTLDSELNSLIETEQLRGENLPGSPLDFLLMGNESLIQANATGNNANGGNVGINTRLLIVLPPTGKNGSDITANAQGGKGGIIAIKAEPLGIYGIEFRKGKTGTSLNDITASSEQGAAGIVSLAIPNVDPSKGLIQLPDKLGDSSKLIAQSCPVGGQQASSQFIVTGRGGLPPNPGAALSSDALVGDATTNTPIQNSAVPESIVEAKGVNIGPKGEIIFTANPSKLASYSSWQKFTGCD